MITNAASTRARFIVSRTDRPSAVGPRAMMACAEEKSLFKIMRLKDAPVSAMENGRGETFHLVDRGLGTENLDLHINRLVPGGPRGRLHRHSRSDNVYLVRSGAAELRIGDEVHRIGPDDVVYIPAGTQHSLSNLSDTVFEVLEIYAPAGSAFDFIAED